MSAPLGTDRRGLQVLDLDVCLSLLRSQTIGRVALMERGELVVFPVNHVMHGTTVAFRTAPGTKLAHAADTTTVGFEVDGLDATPKSGWSVLVQGKLRVATEDEADHLDDIAPPSWIGGEETWVVIDAGEISGRHLQADPVTAPSTGA